MNIFTTQQAAIYISVANISLRNSRLTGLLGGLPSPSFRKLGRKVIYFKSDLDIWLNKLPKYQNTAQYKIGDSHV